MKEYIGTVIVTATNKLIHMDMIKNAKFIPCRGDHAVASAFVGVKALIESNSIESIVDSFDKSIIDNLGYVKTDAKTGEGYDYTKISQDNSAVSSFSITRSDDHYYFYYITFSYKRWNDFYNEFKLLYGGLVSAVFQSGSVQECALGVSDEFVIDGEPDYVIDYKELLNTDNGLIPMRFFESYFPDFSITYSNLKEDFLWSQENISISTSQDSADVEISHMQVFFFDESARLDSVKFVLDYVNYGHDKNKSLIKELLTKSAVSNIKNL